MAKLIYSAITSVDGFVEDDDGGIAWGAPDEEVHAFINDVERPIGTYLYGRRMYESMVFWEASGDGADDPVASRAFADIWRAASKVVYSRTLGSPRSARTRIERAFEPARVAQLKESSERDLSVGGAELAGQAFAAGLVDECNLFVVPVVVGGGKRVLAAGLRAQLDLVGGQAFASGVVHLRYRVVPPDDH